MLQSDELPFGLSIGLGRVSEPLFSVRNVVHNTGLRRNRGAVPDFEVAGKTYLAGDNDVITKLGASSNAGLRYDEAMFPDCHIVCDLNQVIYLGAFADNRRAKRTSIDSDIGADFNVVA